MILYYESIAETCPLAWDKFLGWDAAEIEWMEGRLCRLNLTNLMRFIRGCGVKEINDLMIPIATPTMGGDDFSILDQKHKALRLFATLETHLRKHND